MTAPDAPRSIGDEYSDLPRRVVALEMGIADLRTAVTKDLKDAAVEQRRLHEVTLERIGEIGKRGQITVTQIFGFATTILAICAAGVSTIRAPIQADVDRTRSDLAKIETSYVDRREIDTRFQAQEKATAELKDSAVDRRELEAKFRILDRDVDRSAAGLAKLADNAVMKPELDYRLTVLGKARDEAFQQINQRMDRLRSTTDRLEGSQVSRDEHKDRWTTEDKQIGAINRRIDSLESRSKPP